MASYGSQFAGARLTLVVLLVAAGIQALQTPVLNLLTAKGRMWAVLLLLLSWAVVLLALNAILVGWGALGVASARMVSYMVSSLWISYVAYRLITDDAASILMTS
jgi:O-antigen/teichoic acid export membrane protein